MHSNRSATPSGNLHPHAVFKTWTNSWGGKKPSGVPFACRVDAKTLDVPFHISSIIVGFVEAVQRTQKRLTRSAPVFSFPKTPPGGLSVTFF
jgi:hypothetical protein